ncbi:hypothetical protein FHR83_005636 [Actinoplanes campanulatus]|uniref:DUF3592 domain-containing protein n=1 Tax=Actinoplanes campanulatus TaxID=113559 RepID=A0A7W5AKH3_9ACTN|nr:DUF3592 domain-containing protein [Actinoplanes campanulatus]MBB3097951.1 hypothetical protein [Actinoplanes campanulatus]GGN31566.1 hypothetical protein GCM10010109_51870 [Actinoplanes campanulatus]GID41337.1 hypothetical protein Aca09nite_78430 [Actinoplanes campanulatus]
MGEPKPGDWTWRSRLLLILGAVVFLGAGLTGLVGGIGVKVGSTVKADRLEREGEAVTARLSDYRSSRSKGAPPTVWVSYDFQGRAYRVRTECRVDDLCRPENATTMELKVDPVRPAEFVTAVGGADDSLHCLNSWKMIILGLFVSIMGGALAWGWVYQFRWERRQRRGAVPPQR